MKRAQRSGTMGVIEVLRFIILKDIWVVALYEYGCGLVTGRRGAKKGITRS